MGAKTGDKNKIIRQIMERLDEILCYEIFQLFMEKPEAEKLYIFQYPFYRDGEEPAYFSFAPNEDAKERMKQYIERKLEEMYRIVNKKSKATNIIPTIS